MLLLAICVIIVAVVCTQYYSAAQNSKSMPSSHPLISKDDFLSDSVIDYRNVVPLPDSNKAGSAYLSKDTTMKAKEEAPLDYNGIPLHVVFSTSCSDQMHWYVLLFFWVCLSLRLKIDSLIFLYLSGRATYSFTMLGKLTSRALSLESPLDATTKKPKLPPNFTNNPSKPCRIVFICT